MDIGVFTTPNFNNNVFLFVTLTTLGTFIDFDWLDNQDVCPHVLTTNYNLLNV